LTSPLFEPTRRTICGFGAGILTDPNLSLFEQLAMIVGSEE
jgi:hypothetical protein